MRALPRADARHPAARREPPRHPLALRTAAYPHNERARVVSADSPRGRAQTRKYRLTGLLDVTVLSDTKRQPRESSPMNCFPRAEIINLARPLASRLQKSSRFSRRLRRNLDTATFWIQRIKTENNPQRSRFPMDKGECPKL